MHEPIQLRVAVVEETRAWGEGQVGRLGQMNARNGVGVTINLHPAADRAVTCSAKA